MTVISFMHYKKPFLLGIFTALGIILLDQMTKQLILKHFQDGTNYTTLTAFFDLVLVHNKGVSFGMFDQKTLTGVNVLILITAVITSIMLVWLWRSSSYLQSLSVAYVIGGAVGNIIDRINYGSVIDFLHFHWHQYSFPAFNVADSFISIGAVLILIENIFMSKEQSNNAS